MTTFWQKVWRWVLGEPISSAPAPTFSPPKTSQPKPKPVPPPPKPPTRTIITGTGDTLFALAKKHRTTVQAIARLNRIRPQTPLRAGQRLVIPDFDAGNMAASAPETDFIAPKNTPLKQPAPPRAATRPPKRPFPQKIPPAPAKKPAAPKPAPEKPFVPPADAVAALYLSHHGLGVAAERQALLARLDESFFNTLVIDFKDDWGYLSHPVPNGLAQMSGAQRWTTQDLPALVASLRRKNIRPVARVVAFKDNLIPPVCPHLAAQAAHDGSVWRNAAQVGWLDPFHADVWAYLLDVARAAAEVGFAEVQFDSLYFPHPSPAGLPKFSRHATPVNRCNALAAFLSAARGELAARGVTLSVTVAGYACFRTDDFGTGQDVARLAAHVDALAPLVYPAHFSLGVPGCNSPLAHPAETVARTLHALRGRLASAGFAGTVRPWLQDFPWDAAGQRFDAGTVRAQIRTALDSGATGFGLWHPTGDYSRL